MKKTIGIIMLCMILGVLAIITGYMVEKQNIDETYMYLSECGKFIDWSK